jgi:hypothetical protein
MNHTLKKCSKCNKFLELSAFIKHPNTKDKLKNSCRECDKIYMKEYLSKDNNYNIQNEKNKINSKKKYSSDIVYKNNQNKNNKLFFKQNPKYWEEYREKNREKINKYQRERKEKTNIYRKEKRQNDVNFKLKENIRSYIYQTLKCKKSTSFSIYLGCFIEEYKLYLEKQFDKNMNWDNYGVYWEIDHILPLSSFNLNTLLEQKKAFNYKNTQPLTIHENRSKNGHI